MKIYQLIATVVTAFTLFSCAAEDNNGLDKPTVPAGEPATLKLTITDPVTRALGTAKGDSLINNLTIFVFREDGLIDVKPKFFSKVSAEITASITNLATQVHIVTNVDSTYADTTFSKVADIASFKKLRINLGDKENKKSSQDSLNVTMRGNSNLTWRSDSAQANITLSYCATKIVLSRKSLITDIGTGDLNGAAWECVILNTPANAPLCTTSPSESLNLDTLLYTAERSYVLNDTVRKSKEVPFLLTRVAFDTASGLFQADAHFYVFPNEAEYSKTTLKTIVALRATWRDNSDQITKRRYWSILFEKIEAGKHYEVTFKIPGTSQGAVNPEIEFKAAPFALIAERPLWETSGIEKGW